MKHLSEITNRLIGQPMFALLAKIKEMERTGEKIIHFEIGDPDFDSPDSVVQAVKNSLDNKETHYTNSMGLWDLRQEICSFTEKSLGFKPSVEQVLVIPANAIIDFVIRCVVNPGEEVIIPDPGFPTYRAVLNYTGIKAKPVPMNPNDIRKAITDKTRLIIINSPNNPTGLMLTKEEIAEVVAIAKENDIYLLSDEVYSRITYDKVHYSPSIYDQCKERTIILNSFSKIYSMSGWRLGYAIGPEPVIKKMGLLLETIISCFPPFIQRAGITALKYDVNERNKELRRRRDILINGLNSIGIKCLKPDGAFYAFAKTDLTQDEILERAHVAVLDGKYFGEQGKGYIRLCYASASIDEIKKAINQIKTIL